MTESRRSNAIPSGWTRVPIGQLLAPFENANPAKSGRENFWYVDIEAIDNQEHRIATPKLLPTDQAPSRARKVIREDDVLISLVRPYLKNIALVPPELDDQWASTAFCVCRPRAGVDPRFLYYLYLQTEFLNAIPTYGDSPPSGHDDDLLATVIALPPQAEQSRIADRIDELFTDLAAGVAALERVKRNLSRYRAAVLHAAVTGRLTEAWRKEHGPPDEPAPKLLKRILVERRKQWERRTLAAYEAKGKLPPKNWKSRYKEPAPPKANDREQLPSAWAWATVEQLTRGDRDSAYGVLVPGEDVPDGVPLIRIGDIKNGKVDLNGLKRIAPSIAAKFQRTFLEGGEMLISLVGTIGRTAVAPPEAKGANTARAVGVIPLSPLIDAHFVEFWFRNPTRVTEMTLKSHEVARKTLNLEDVRPTLVAMPPHGEQMAIVEAVNEKLSQIDALDAEVARGLARAARLRQAILKAAFEGKLVPQDPSDEPASVLLERIRQQAADTPKPKRQTRMKTPRKAATR